MTRIEIGERPVGGGAPCYVIAEAGSNHNGSLDQAIELVRIAAAAGADAVKFQTFRAETMYPRGDSNVDYLRGLGVTKPIYDLICEMEMPFEWIPTLAQECFDRGIHFLSSPFDEDCVDRIAEFVPAFKIASYELTHVPLIRHAARYGKPLILSTGAAEVDDIVSAIDAASDAPVALLQCTAKYPAPVETLNVRTIPAMRERFGVPVGLSDHSVEPLYGPLAAAAVGAAILEKHFTISKRLPGPDHSFALEPDELASMIAGVHAVEAALGQQEKGRQPIEAELANYRRSVYSIGYIEKGQAIGEKHIAVLRRPGVAESGIEPARSLELIGRVARRSIEPYHLMTWDDIEADGSIT